MAIIITVTATEILKLCRLDISDTTAIADANEMINFQQEAFEKILKPSALSDPALTAFLRRNLAKLLAGELLRMLRREEGAGTSFQGVGVTLGIPPNLGKELADEAWLALAPYTVRAVGVNVGADTLPVPEPVTGANGQDALYGEKESTNSRF